MLSGFITEQEVACWPTGGASCSSMTLEGFQDAVIEEPINFFRYNSSQRHSNNSRQPSIMDTAERRSTLKPLRILERQMFSLDK
jgi:hypothetical protein